MLQRLHIIIVFRHAKKVIMINRLYQLLRILIINEDDNEENVHGVSTNSIRKLTDRYRNQFCSDQQQSLV